MRTAFAVLGAVVLCLCSPHLALAAKASGRLAAPRGLVATEVELGVTTLRWNAVERARAYRVLRNGKVIGQGRDRSRRVNVGNVRRVLRVVAISRTGRRGRTSAPLVILPGHRAPDAPTNVTVSGVSTTGLTVSWRASRARSAPVRAYRVLRNGAVVGQFRPTTAILERLAPAQRYDIGVAAVDSRGYVSAPATVAADTAAPEPTHGHAHAFLLASTDSSFDGFARHYRQVGTVYPTYFECDSARPERILGRDDPRITTFAQARRVAVLPRLDCQRPHALAKILNDRTTGDAVIARSVELADTHGYDGIMLDYEAGAASDRDAMTAFVGRLADALHHHGRRLGIAVSPKVADVPNHPRSTIFDYAELVRRVDTMFVMAWGLKWVTSPPGPRVQLDWLDGVLNYVATMPLRERWVIGTLLYAHDWPAGGGPEHPATAMEYAQARDLVARVGAGPGWHAPSGEWTFSYTDSAGVPHEVWYSDARSLVETMGRARSRGFGVGLWRMGQEDPEIWNTWVLAP